MNESGGTGTDGRARGAGSASAHPLFAEDARTGRWMDVGDVRRGLECGCVCTVCRARLVARQGDVLVWHFAHEANASCTRTAEDAALESLVAMIEQLLGGGAPLRLPSHAVVPLVRRGTSAGPPVPITGETSVVCDAIERDRTNGQANVALLARVRAHPIRLVLEKSANVATTRPTHTVACVALELDALVNALGDTGDGSSATERLRRWLADTADGRRWLYHPREERLLSEATARALPPATASGTATRYFYRCDMCSRTYAGEKGTKPPCPACGEAFWIQSLPPQVP